MPAFKTTKAMALALVLASLAVFQAEARDRIRIVGSSTVFPFTTVVAETFARKTGARAPVVESTGTGGGFKLFCAGVGADTPDFANASRTIKPSEVEQCSSHGVTPVEIKIGYDGIVLAHAQGTAPVSLTRAQIFAALARQVPVNGVLVDNPHTRWSDIDPSLPDQKIRVLGPPPTSGTRDAFLELVMEEGGMAYPLIAAKKKDKALFKALTHALREDGAFIEVGEQDNLIVRKLENDEVLMGIFGFSFLDQNEDKVQGVAIEGVVPTFENIVAKDYKVSRPLFVYAKREHMDIVEGMEGFVAEYLSEDAIGEDGYLAERSLIPLPVPVFQRITSEVRAALR